LRCITGCLKKRDLATENGVPHSAAPRKKGSPTGAEAALGSLTAAKLAKLRHVSGDMPGITRHEARRGVYYRFPNGEIVRDVGMLKRIRSLVIPPAWTAVWICPYANGHIQAIGRDKRRPSASVGCFAPAGLMPI
jgi:DNA topoisomerase IB